MIGGSGTGKSVLLRECIGLSRPTRGHVRLFGENICDLSRNHLNQVRSRYGVLFQEGALFSSLTRCGKCRRAAGRTHQSAAEAAQ